MALSAKLRPRPTAKPKKLFDVAGESDPVGTTYQYNIGEEGEALVPQYRSIKDPMSGRNIKFSEGVEKFGADSYQYEKTPERMRMLSKEKNPTLRLEMEKRFSQEDSPLSGDKRMMTPSRKPIRKYIEPKPGTDIFNPPPYEKPEVEFFPEPTSTPLSYKLKQRQ